MFEFKDHAPIAIEGDDAADGPEPAWLLLGTVGFAIGVALLLLFYVGAA